MSFLSKLLGGGSKPRQPKIEKDSLASISTAKILYGLAEGEISGLVDGAKSIKLDDTPLLNDAGQPNFVDDKEKLAVKWDFRSGSNNQDYIQGFPDVANEKSVGVQLRQATPYVKQINDINLSAIVVRVSFGALRNQKTNGDITGTTVKYRIDLMTDNGTYQTVIDGNVTAKTSAKYERSHRIDLPKAKNGWLVKVTRITPDSTSDLLSNAMSVEAITEIIDVKLAYPNTAMLGIQYDARTFSNIAKLLVRCRGKLLRTPSNYDPVGRTYNGIWDGTFKTAYSNNPAWVFYDICLNWRYGLGRRLDASMIDKWALYQIARYCDEMVSDGLGGQEPRFAVNVYLQSQQDAFTVLQSLSSIFRGMAYWNGEQVTVTMDAPQTPVYTFSRANVVDGIFNYTGTRARDRHTVAKVAWDNPKNDFKTEYEPVRDEYAIAKYGINQLDINMMGCTSQGQAQRAGLWALKSEQLENRQVSFSIGLDGMLERIKPSAIIAISDEVFAGRANGGRIVAISGDRKTITLDRVVTANVGDTLVINNSDGVAERQTISAINGADITVSVAFDKPEAQHIWAIDSPNLRLMLFKIISIKQNDDLTHTITAIQHEPQKYAAVDSGAYVQPQRVSVVEPNIVAAPEAVAIGQFERQIQGQTVVTMTIGWTQVKDAVSYIVEFKRDDGNWVKLAPQGGLSVDVEGVYAGNYLARVTAVNAYDLQSMPKTSMLTAVVGKLGTPPTLASLKATGILFGMQLDWLFAQGSSDTNYTEIQVASAPDTNVALLGTYAYPTNTATINGLQGNLTQYYRGRIVDKLGNASPWTAWVKGVTSADASKVLDLLNGQITESQLYKDLGAKIEKIGTIGDAVSQAQQAADDAADIAKKAVLDAGTVADSLAQEIVNRGEAIQLKGEAIEQDYKNHVDTLLNAPNGVNERIIKSTDGLTTYLKTYKDSNGKYVGGVVDEITTKIGDNGTLVTKLDGVFAQVNPEMAGSSKDLAGNDKFAGTWTEMSARIEGETATSQRIDSVVSAIGDNNAKITTLNKTVVDGDKALAERIDNISVNFNGNVSNVITTYMASQNATDAITGRMTNYYTEKIEPELKTKATVTGLQGLSGEIKKVDGKLVGVGDKLDSLVIDLDSPTGKIQSLIADETRTRIDENRVITTSINGIFAQINPEMAGNDESLAGDNGKAAGVWTETSARIEADSSLSLRIDNLDSKFGDNNAKITSQYYTLADSLSSVASKVDLITALSDDNVSEFVNTVYTKAATNDAISSGIRQFKTDYYDKEMPLKASAKAVEDITNLVGEQNQNITAMSQKIDGVFAQVNPEMAGNDESLAGNDKQAGVWTEQSARIEGDVATGIRIDNAVSEINGIKAAIQEQGLTYSNGVDALAAKITTVQGVVDGQKQSVEVIQGVGDVTKLKLETEKARNDNSIDALTVQATKLQDSITTLTKQIANLNDKRTPDNAALTDESIAKLQAARVEAQTALDAIPAQKQQLLDEKKRLDSLVLTESKIKNQYTIRLDGNNRVAGFGLALDDTNNFDFAIRADKFYIAPPSGTGNGVSPFMVLTSPQVINGTVVPVGTYIKGDLIATGSVTADKIDTRGLTIKDATGKVLFGSGTGLDVANITGLGSLATKSSLTTSDVGGLGTLATKNSVTTSEVTGLGGLATKSTVSTSEVTGLGALAKKDTVTTNEVTGLGSLAKVDKLTTSNITTYVEGLGVRNLLVGDAQITSANIGTAEVDTLNIKGQAVTVTSAVTQTTFFDAKTSANTDAIYLYTGGVVVAVEFSLISCNPEGSGSFLVECYVNDVVKGSWNLSGTFGYYPSMFFPFSVATGTEQTKVHIKVTSKGAKIGSQGYFFKVTGLKR